MPFFVLNPNCTINCTICMIIEFSKNKIIFTVHMVDRAYGAAVYGVVRVV